MSMVSAIIIQHSLPRLIKSKISKDKPVYPEDSPSRPLIRPFRDSDSPFVRPTLYSGKASCSAPSSSPASRTIISILSRKRSTTISRNMANHSLSSSDASLGNHRHHSSSPQWYGLGVLVNFAKCTFWNCSHCSHVNNMAYCPQMCGNCGHRKCGQCNQYTN